MQRHHFTPSAYHPFNDSRILRVRHHLVQFRGKVCIALLVLDELAAVLSVSGKVTISVVDILDL